MADTTRVAKLNNGLRAVPNLPTRVIQPPTSSLSFSSKNYLPRVKRAGCERRRTGCREDRRISTSETAYVSSLPATVLQLSPRGIIELFIHRRLSFLNRFALIRGPAGPALPFRFLEPPRGNRRHGEDTKREFSMDSQRRVTSAWLFIMSRETLSGLHLSEGLEEEGRRGRKCCIFDVRR